MWGHDDKKDEKSQIWKVKTKKAFKEKIRTIDYYMYFLK